VVSAPEGLAGCAFFAADVFADDFALVPNDSARALGLVLLADGAGAWPGPGVATRADARRKAAICDCTALARRKGNRNAAR